MILRNATEADALDVWAWRQDPLTRAMSRSAEAVELASHMAWFAKALADPARMLLIGEADGEKVGMVRFDRGEVTEVSINVNPQHRGRGLGFTLLSEALNRVEGDVWAEVKDENLASRRLFERAGFELHDAAGGFRRYRRAGGGAA
jgi:ribosomal protein S18 acetylase RimI-like enzyme